MRTRRYRDGVDGGILDDDRLRIVILGLIFLLAFFILLFRLYFLQLHHGDEHRKLINKQSERRVRIPGLRGRIFSSDNMILADNKPSYDLLFFPSEMHQGGRKKTAAYMYECARKIARFTGRENVPSKEEFARHLVISPGVPKTVFQDLSTEELARIFEAARHLKGIDIQPSPVRVYPGNDMAAHIIGYTRKADASRAGDRNDFFYYNPDLEGKSGIESAFDTFGGDLRPLGLRAYPGRSVIQVNNIGYAQKELLGRTEPIHGNDAVLTIDSRAQKLAEELLGDLTGAMVVVDADNGDIICAATAPRMDLARFSPKLEPSYYQELLNNPEKPLINRAFQAIYPPGSSIKPLMCMAFLEAGIDPEEIVYCSGSIRVGNTVIRCSAHRYYGDDMTMGKALEKSCNSYMIHHGVNVGVNSLSQMLKHAGFGRKTGLPIPENAGDLPSNELKMRRYKTRWNAYDTALLSIGQGIISVTPLQLALYTAAIANGGTVWKPQLLKRILDNRGISRFERTPQAYGKLPVSPEHLETVRKGMFRVVNSSGGSGRNGRVAGMDIYGKTGTAEIGSAGSIRNITHFIAFVSYENRNYALAVTIEDGRSGGRTCAPLAAEFFRRYLQKQPGM
ncbi:MAG: hypothetical protein E7057_06670 [Lentisphaerae bacterium]|nr:hypothetical protein [Lentisphaerota bacterium]